MSDHFGTLYIKELRVFMAHSVSYVFHFIFLELEDRIEKIKKICELIDKLPPAHYETLKYFCRHLQR